jgi:hypothetical protein
MRDADGHRVKRGKYGWARVGIAFPCQVAESRYFADRDPTGEREIAFADKRAP